MPRDPSAIAPVPGPQRFGPSGRFELRAHERRLLVAGQPAALGARAFDLLLALVECPGQMLTKHALMDRVWPGVVVVENNLVMQIGALRKVLGNDLIATIPGRGYCFTADLDWAPHASTTAPAQPAAPATLRRRGADRRGARQDGSAEPAAPATLRTNLPKCPQPLLGRADELAALGVLVQAHRLVTVVGAGGIGKTRLAQACLDGQRNAHRHGVCWVELATVTDPAALPGTIASALGVRPQEGEPLVGLCAAVAPLQVLVALDNAEHLLADVARAAQALLDKAPGLRLVVTSQAPLKLADEQVLRLDGLAVPPGPLPADQAIGFGAVALFVERAQAADRRFVLTDSNAPAVVDICRALDGMALAIELAAARTPILGVCRLASPMQDRLKMLTVSHNRAAPARQQTLRAALEWSHGFLDEREQAVFRRLAVMAGGASLPLIQQVVADPPGQGELDEWTVLDALGVLVDRSLVAVLMPSDRSDGDTEPRYRLLDTPRLYALERLAAGGEHDALRQRHALAMAALFDAAYGAYHSGVTRQDNWAHALSADFDNAREALATAQAAGDATTVLQIAATMILALPGAMHSEGMALCTLCEPLLERVDRIGLQLRAGCHIAVQLSRRSIRHAFDVAQDTWQRARCAPPGGVGAADLYRVLCTVALVGSRSRRLESAEAALLEARALEDKAWPPQITIYRIEAEASFAKTRGDAAEALRMRYRLVELEVASGMSGARALNNVVEAELAAGHALAAATTGVALVASMEGARDEYHATFVRLNTGAAWLALDDTRQARAVLQPGWAQAGSFDLQRFFADYLALLAAIEVRPRAAATLAGYADAVNEASVRQPNEAAAVARASTLARAALGDAAFDRLRAEGATLRDEEIAAVAFGAEDLP